MSEEKYIKLQSKITTKRIGDDPLGELVRCSGHIKASEVEFILKESKISDSNIPLTGEFYD